MQFLKFKSLLPAASTVLCSCSTRLTKKITLDGERISVLDGETALQPDYAPGQSRLCCRALCNTALVTERRQRYPYDGTPEFGQQTQGTVGIRFRRGSSKRDFLIARSGICAQSCFYDRRRRHR